MHTSYKYAGSGSHSQSSICPSTRSPHGWLGEEQRGMGISLASFEPPALRIYKAEILLYKYLHAMNMNTTGFSKDSQCHARQCSFMLAYHQIRQ